MAATERKEEEPPAMDFMRQVVQQSSFVTELLDSKTLNLVKDMHASKYILSNDMAAQLLALISCCPERHAVYNELLW